MNHSASKKGHAPEVPQSMQLVFSPNVRNSVSRHSEECVTERCDCSQSHPDTKLCIPITVRQWENCCSNSDDTEDRADATLTWTRRCMRMPNHAVCHCLPKASRLTTDAAAAFLQQTSQKVVFVALCRKRIAMLGPKSRSSEHIHNLCKRFPSFGYHNLATASTNQVLDHRHPSRTLK